MTRLKLDHLSSRRYGHKDQLISKNIRMNKQIDRHAVHCDSEKERWRLAIEFSQSMASMWAEQHYRMLTIWWNNAVAQHYFSLNSMWPLLVGCASKVNGRDSRSPCLFFVADSVKHATGPLLIEIEKSPGSTIGLNLTHKWIRNSRSVILIDSVKSASIADR